MKKCVGVILLIAGLLMSSWHGLMWWEEASAVTSDQKEASSLSADSEKTAVREKLLHKERFSENSKETPTKGEEIGRLIIPRLDKIYPVYWGTGQQALKRGIGMYDSPSMTPPDQYGHTGLAGHRDTVFVGLDQLQSGDRIYLEFHDATYAYQIRKTWITDANDRSVLTEKQAPTLTLTTCYPFDFIGPAPDRYIIQAELIGTQDAKDSA
ncbi:class D sortase [Virgibacillus senegalensis]|uniref:class D sortase n=1 Tax=Virgibacillus senegalensis TaxID=1499679 RepID=UPI00069DC7EF|nr:class D sortase [Virgibacillus senegalensis]